MHRVAVAVILLVILLGAIAFAPPSQGGFLWLRTLHNFAHGPIFGCIALILLYVLRGQPRFAARTPLVQYGVIFAIAFALGIATEIAQLGTGRDASIEDLITDLLGASAFLLVFSAIDPALRASSKRRRSTLALAGLMLVLVLAWPPVEVAYAYAQRARSFPVIVDFNERLGLRFVAKQGVLAQAVPLPERWAATPGERALHVRFVGDAWPGVEIFEVPPDWSEYRVLVLDLVNPSETDLNITVRIDDRQHNRQFHDRYNGRFILRARTREVLRIPLSEVERAPRGRPFDLQHVARMLIFKRETQSDEALYFVRAALE